jgi:ParB/Sulfiredoxin domain
VGRQDKSSKLAAARLKALLDWTATPTSAQDSAVRVSRAPGHRRMTAPGLLMAFLRARAELEDRIDEFMYELAFGKPQMELPIHLIDPIPWRRRAHSDFGAKDDSVDSSADAGLREFVIVRRVTKNGGTTRYQLMAGEHCFRVHKELEKDGIAAVLVEIDNKAQAALARAEEIAEPTHRFDVALNVGRQIKELTYALRLSRVPITGALLGRAKPRRHGTKSMGTSITTGTAIATQNARSYRLAGGPAGGSGRHATLSGEPVSQEKQATCEHEWERDGQTMTAVRWTCTKCGRSELRGLDI